MGEIRKEEEEGEEGCVCLDGGRVNSVRTVSFRSNTQIPHYPASFPTFPSPSFIIPLTAEEVT